MRRCCLICLALLFVVLCGCRARLVDAPEPMESTAPSAQPTATPEPTPEPASEPALESTAPPETAPSDVPAAALPVSPGSVRELGQEQVTGRPVIGVTVTYEPNGGDGSAVTASVEMGEPYGLQPETTRRGYAFDGWWTASVGGQQVLSDTIVEREEAHSLYAHWRARPAATVTFDGCGGRVKSRDVNREISQGDALGPLPTPLREGYGFEGWFTQSEGGEPVSEDTVYTGPGDWTLYARWSYDPYEFWSFTLRNHIQQIFQCQQVSIYFETRTDGVTAQSCPLIAAIGGQNVAESRSDPGVTDDWVLGKRPQVVLKEVDSLENAAKVRSALSARFPEQKVVLVTGEGLGGGAQGLYARLALAKELYGDWYTDVDLPTAAAELGVEVSPIQF